MKIYEARVKVSALPLGAEVCKTAERFKIITGREMRTHCQIFSSCQKGVPEDKLLVQFTHPTTGNKWEEAVVFKSDVDEITLWATTPLVKWRS